MHTRPTKLTRHNCIIYCVYVYLAAAPKAQPDNTFEAPNKCLIAQIFHHCRQSSTCIRPDEPQADYIGTTATQVWHYYHCPVRKGLSAAFIQS